MEKTEMIKSLYGGDQRVAVLLGKQRKPAPGKRLRKSMFVHSLYMDAHYLLFHTLTRQILLVEPELIEWFMGGRTFDASTILENEYASWFYDHYFLVPEDEKESRIYMEVKDLVVLKEERPDEIVSYVILPTTACNARCFYCFENGMGCHHMTEENVQNTVRFIVEHRPKRNRIHIHWFGGEPTIVPETIDRICDGLTEAGVEFDAEMTSNGSLLNEQLAKKAADSWKVRKVQITLDGMSEEYEKRKDYVSTVKNPFGTVTENIHLLLKENIRIAIRLNADENNIGDLYRCARFLKMEFTEEERQKLSVYAHSLFGQPGEELNGCQAGTGSDELESAVLELNEYLIRTGLMKKDLTGLFSFKSSFCMVTVPENGTVIDAEGRLFACEGMPDNMCYGDLKTGIDPRLWKEISRPDTTIQKQCGACTFLPQCTEFSRCPNRRPFSDCEKQEKRLLNSDLVLAYNFLMDRKKQTEMMKKES